MIRSLDGQPIANGGALQVVVSEDMPGTNISLGILRDGSPQTLKIKVGEFHAKAEVADNEGDPSAPNAKPGKLGVSVGDLTDDVRQQLRIPENVKGVAVESVRPESPAEDAGLAPGDVILELNRQPVGTADKIHLCGSGKFQQGHDSAGLVARWRKLPGRASEQRRLTLSIGTGSPLRPKLAKRAFRFFTENWHFRGARMAFWCIMVR